ncbi:hypothetical protein ACHAWU_002546 [Discostella pseudostelligera]|uniref:Uncharacterized protein n=1 Tax=Discostella pseudostelligera TaxID=259834 RepID=A0ABD3LYU0_9STRA
MMTAASSSIITAEFSSYEDFSSRMILLPLHDDECTGARVESHVVVVVPTAVNAIDERVSSKVDIIEVVEGGEEALEESEPIASENMTCADGDEPTTEELEDSVQVATMAQAVDEELASENTTTMNGTKLEATVTEFVDQHDCGEGTSVQVHVPVGYVLVKIITCNDGENNAMTEELESMEFTDILSFLRKSPFPLSLEFAPPNPSTPTSSQVDDGSSAFELDDGATSSPMKATTDAIKIYEVSSDNDECALAEVNDSSSQSLSTLVSRDDAAKFAKQAATELRGRLSRWGYQAATLAVDAATQVKELRDERQRKIKDEHQDRDGENQSVDVVGDDAKEEGLDVESKPPDGDELVTDNSLSGPCSIFIQSSSGFVQIQPRNSSPITNKTVISVRLSKDEACPLGKNGYTFQWYRSNTDVGIMNKGSQQSADEESKDNAQNWTFLRGACYAAYQPSMSDVGHYLRCIVTSDDTVLQACTLPFPVTMEQSYLDNAKNSLFGGTKSISFGNLQEVDGAKVVRLKIDIVSNDDFISNSCIYIESTSHGSVEDKATNATNDLEPVLHFRVEVDPSKPKRFALVSASHGRLKLDAANRKSRESLVLALGIANYKGNLSSLTTKTALFPSFEYDDSTHVEVDGSSPSLQPTRLGAEFTEMNLLLLSKDFAISKIRDELVAFHAVNRQLEIELQQCRDAEQVLKPALELSEAKATELAQTIDEMKQAQINSNALHEKAVKALNNEKAVLLAAVEARDGKIDGLKNQISELVKQSSLQSEKLSTIEGLRNDLVKAQDRYSLAEKDIAELKAKESELQKELTSAKENASMFESDCRELKQIASKSESEFKRLKAERNSLKHRAEGLSKEMLRMSKNKSDTSEVEKLTKLVHELNMKNTDLAEQVEVAKLENRRVLETLDATIMAHQQSVRFQLSTEANNGANVVQESRVRELESVISSMTEHLNAKDMQIETLKQINKALLEDK